MEAWVTLATNDAYRYFQLLVTQIYDKISYPENSLTEYIYAFISMGALTLAASLKRTNTLRKLAVMVTSEGCLMVRCHPR